MNDHSEEEEGSSSSKRAKSSVTPSSAEPAAATSSPVLTAEQKKQERLRRLQEWKKKRALEAVAVLSASVSSSSPSASSSVSADVDSVDVQEAPSSAVDPSSGRDSAAPQPKDKGKESAETLLTPPASSPVTNKNLKDPSASECVGDDDDEVDPLDAFMVGIRAEVQKLTPLEVSHVSAPSSAVSSSSVSTNITTTGSSSSSSSSSSSGTAAPLVTIVRSGVQSSTLAVGDEESDSDEEGAAAEFRPREERYYSDEELPMPLDDDEDANAPTNELDELAALLPGAAKRRQLLEKVDHSKVNYEHVRKDFYIEVPEITALSEEEVEQYREELNIKVRGKRCPRPVRTFHQCGLTSRILSVLERLEYREPTPIQAQAVPAVMKGRDVIAIARTGSGKTLAFVLPVLRHVLDQPPLKTGDGPIAVVMAPTRELALQIHSEFRRFCKRLGLSCVCVYGGAGVAHQIGDLKRGAEIVVCTPGRMIDVLSTNAGRVTNLRRCTFVVLDEADRMFDMGFEPQIMHIIENVRPSRQTVMFSATFPMAIQAAARKILRRPLEITVGGRSIVCADVDQQVEVLEREKKFLRLQDWLARFYDRGLVLIFVETQAMCDQLFGDLLKAGYGSLVLHGGIDQSDRHSTITDFKKKRENILVATSLAARGLDVKDLILVVNYVVPSHLEDYVHRCGRTGRAGNKGTAVTFVTPDEERFAPDIVRALTESKAEVPAALKELADGYENKKKAGVLVQGKSSGYGGRGYSFDPVENERARMLTLLTEQVSYGLLDASELRLLTTGQGEDHDDEVKSVAAGQSAAAAAAAHAMKEQAASTIRGISLMMPVSENQAVQLKPASGDASTGASASSSSSAGETNNSAANAADEAKSEAARRALQYIATLNSQFKQKQNQQQGAGAAGTRADDQKFVAELEINDYSQRARWKVTHKDASAPITEVTGATITTRGIYCPAGTKPPQGERKLHLFIEGTTEQSVHDARDELRRILLETELQSHQHKERGGGGGSNRYQVL